MIVTLASCCDSDVMNICRKTWKLIGFLKPRSLRRRARTSTTNLRKPAAIRSARSRVV